MKKRLLKILITTALIIFPYIQAYADGDGYLAAKVIWDNLKTGNLTTKAISTPSALDTVRLEVSGSDITTVSGRFNASLGIGLLSGIPAGTDRTIKFFGEDSAGNVLYTASETITILPRQTTTVNLYATEVTSNVNPMFSGGGIHSTVLKKDGKIWAWGDNDSRGFGGQLGDGSTVDSAVPVQTTQATELIAVTAIAAGELHTVALKFDGTVWTWGNNERDQLGNGTSGTVNYEDSPVQIPDPADSSKPFSDVVQIASGVEHSLTLKSDDTVWAWGANPDGQLGNGTQDDSDIPVQVSGLSNVVALTGGVSHSVALDSDGDVWIWGHGVEGQLGDNSTTSVTTPQKVAALDAETIVAIVAGGWHTLALEDNGDLWIWGDNATGQIGNGATGPDVLLPFNLLSSVTAISAGEFHSIALMSDGTLNSWGLNEVGQLGDNNSPTNSNVPVAVSGLTDVTAISAGSDHNLAQKSDGTLWAWGDNSDGQLGDGTTTNSDVPVQVIGMDLSN